MYDTLVSTEVLAEHIGDPDWIICDCRFVLTNPEAGQTTYQESHLPGAVYFHLDRDLAGPITSSSGRHPLPTVEQLSESFSRAGITADTQIVAYDDANGAIAARLWWLARWLGHRQSAVLDGGWQGWVNEDLPITADPATPVKRHFTPHRDDALLISASEVLAIANGRKPGKLLDARAAERFQGRNETLDPVAGHIPGAVNLPFAGNVEITGRFKRPAELHKRIEIALDGTRPEQAVCMCGSGVTACHDLLAMELAGFHGAQLYAGSWSEWIRDPSRPVATGA